MPFDRPDPQEILRRIEAEIDIALPGADARLRRSVEGVIARVLAMASHELYGYLEWISQQILPDTAEQEYLERHASLWGIARRPASHASGIVQFSGTDGSIVPAGSILVRNDEAAYTLTADIVFAAGVGSGPVVAAIAGASGNADAGTRLRLSSPVAGVVSDGSAVAPGLTGGADQEGDDLLRTRVIERIRQPPHGGASFDYDTWAKEIPGVTRVWGFPTQYGPGTVAVTFVMDDKIGTIFPSAGEVAVVQSHIDFKRPVTADVTVFAPVAMPVNLEIHLNPNTIAVQNAIRDEIADLFRREASPGGTLYLSRIREAISTAGGEFDHILVAPAANVVAPFGQIPVPGNYVFAGT